MPRTGRDDPAHPCIGYHHRLDRACRARASRRRRQADRAQLRQEDRGRPSAHGDEFAGGAADLHGHRSIMALLETHALKAFYGDFQALYGIDTELSPGETVAIIGTNGAGKSTYLKSIAGLIRNNPEG